MQADASGTSDEVMNIARRYTRSPPVLTFRSDRARHSGQKSMDMENASRIKSWQVGGGKELSWAHNKHQGEQHLFDERMERLIFDWSALELYLLSDKGSRSR